MGAYLSEPKTTKDSTDLEGDVVRSGASSMQGWRISQEDAHNCILEFDKAASLFAVYDGHGGHEVAEYCSKKLPDFIKKNENYLKGNFEEALKDAFLAFDATLATPEVVVELKAIAGGKGDENRSSDAEGGSESEGEEAIDNLVQEAHMPLDEVMAKYKAGPHLRLLKGESKPPVSPMLRARRSICAGPSSSGAGSSSSAANAGDGEVSSSSSSHQETKEPGLCNGDIHKNGEVKDKVEKIEEAEAQVESSDAKVVKGKRGIGKSEARTEPDSSGLSNGESHDVSSSSEGEGGGGGDGEAISSSSPPKKKNILSAEIYQKLLDDDSDSEEEDETFTADAEGSEDGSSDVAEGVEKEGDGEGDDDEEDDDDDEESSIDEEEEEEEEDNIDYGKEEPGLDSGCTAVVALMVGSDLFVANAGDSRCVVCRDGKAMDMSFDHKPEDDLEKERIEGAGGKVTCDGRVNGGLNLSRAIGDHSYKQTKGLSASQQMITALPDVQRTTVEPSTDQFMVLACDGIWNSMTSQEVVDFVRIKLEQKTERLSQICEELFDYCLAPNTQGDGTGCDNMTCVIVQFKALSAALKRPADDLSEEQPCSKRTKVDGEEATS